MEYSQLLAAHKGIIYLFLSSITFKVVMMVVNKEKFKIIRDKTKVVEMVLGTLILASGGWLLAKTPFSSQGWLHVKMTLAIIGIPLAIVGFKKQNVMLAALSLGVFFYVFYMGVSKGFIG